MKKKIQIKPNLEIVDGKVSTTSLDIAEKFEKKHKDVLKTIRQLECSASFNGRNFAPVKYKDAKGEKRPMFHITRDGFAILVMGFTGKKAMQWKEKYIAAFNRMEEELKKQWLAAKLQASKIRLSDWDAISSMMEKAFFGSDTFTKILNSMGFSKEGPIPDKYQQIPTSRLIPFVHLARKNNPWAANLIKRTQNIDVPVMLPQST